MSNTKEPLLEILKEIYDYDVEFHVQDIYQLLSNISSTLYDHLEVSTAGVLRDVQELRDSGDLTFVDYNGTYFLNRPSVVNSKENIFSLEMLERHGRILMWNDKTKTTSAPGITFVRWMIADKNEVMSHTIARELGIECQTRVDQALFKNTQDEIRDSIISEGYDYRCCQPAVSELDTPIKYKGKTYKFITRDGNNRYELPWNHFPCALIKGKNEYSLLQYGAMANNPTKEKKNDCTPNDVKYIIRLGFDCGEIEKTEEAVYEILATRYKEIRKKDRRNFVAEILAEEGIKVSIEPYTKNKAEQHLIENYGVEMNEPDDFVAGWGRKPDHHRKLYEMFEFQLKNPEVYRNAYYFLEMGNGVETQPTESNARTQRILMESERKIYINHCCDVADLYRAGQLKPINVKWLAQVNSKEPYNVFQ
ncbi:MAG: hypothetical protein EBR82_34455 [Caulobacteraceae bacterium]|nr:hypothetical protein [Caulobacteraceae bacterium]